MQDLLIYLAIHHPYQLVAILLAIYTLSASPHAGEAEQALRKAWELATRHKIDIAELDLDEATERIVHQYFKIGKRLSVLEKLSLNIVVRFLHVDICLCWCKVAFVGTDQDIAIAHYVYEFLVRVGRSHLRQFEHCEKSARRRMTKLKRANFIQGFIYGIANNLNAEKSSAQLDAPKAAIVLSKAASERKTYLDELIPDQKTIQTKPPKANRNALMVGFSAGKNTTVSIPLTSPQSRLALL